MDSPQYLSPKAHRRANSAVRRILTLPALDPPQAHAPLSRRSHSDTDPCPSSDIINGPRVPSRGLKRSEDYARECARRGVLPITTETVTRCLHQHPAEGGEHSSRHPRTSTLPRGVFGDARVSAWCAAGLLAGQKVVRLTDAAVEHAGALSIARTLGDDVETLDLTGNTVGTHGAAAIGQAVVPNLKTLVLSTNGLGDAAVKALCEGLLRKDAPRLTNLSLAENQITRGGRDIGNLLVKQTSLSLLDLHWNYIAGDGALGLFQGLAEHYACDGHLARLDVSWNGIAHSGANATMAILAKMLCQECPLIHLDLSYNNLRAEECQLLGDGIKDNHSLVGLHLVGNQATVDADGFVVAAASQDQSPTTSNLRPPAPQVQTPLELVGLKSKRKLISRQEKNAIAAAFRSVDKDGSNSIDPSELEACLRGLGMETTLQEATEIIAKNDTDGNQRLDLREFTFLAEKLLLKQREKEEGPKGRDMSMNRDRSVLEMKTSCWICESWETLEISWKSPATAAFLFTSLDDFKKATHLSPGAGGRFVCDRIFPPGQTWAVLQVDKEIKLLPGLPTALLPDPVTVRLRAGEGLNIAENTLVSVSEVSLIELGNRDQIGGGVAKRSQRAVVCDDPDNPAGFLVVPRVTETEFKTRKQKGTWQFKKSIFASWRFEDEKMYGSCAAQDWQHAKGHKFIKLEDQLQSVSQAVTLNYPHFIRLYRRCAATSTSGSSTFGVSMTVASELLSSAGIVDDQYCRLADIDTMYIAARVIEKGADKRPFAVKVSDTLLRFQFMEFLVRVAVARYMKTGEADSPAGAVGVLFKNLMPEIRRPFSDFQQFFSELHTEECDEPLKDYEPFLRSLYRNNSGKFNKPGEEKTMTAKEWEDMLLAADAFTDTFPPREAHYAFKMGLQLCPDELYDLNSTRMSFLEFITALSAVVYLRREAGPLSSRLRTFLETLTEANLLSGIFQDLRN